MELIIFVGLQASGKSTFFRTYFAATHVLVSKDLLHKNKSRQQRQLIEAALQAGHSVVIDNTNPTLEDRAELIQFGRSYGAEIICYCFEPQVSQSLARNRQRTGKERVPDIAIFTTMKRFVHPLYKEGFDKLFYVNANDDGTFKILLSAQGEEDTHKGNAPTGEIIEQLLEHFPGRIHSCYIEGSYADNSSVITSDIDLIIIFKGSFVDEQECARAEAIVHSCSSPHALEIDAIVRDEQSLVGGISPNFKMGSMLFYGQDIRSQLPLLPLIEWTRDRMHSSYWRTVHLFKRPHIITYPLDYPDASAAFYGYDARKIRLTSGQEVNCTRDLIRLVGWSATAIIAFKAHRYVARKSDCHKIYQQCFHDEWGQLLQDIYEQCRGRWRYLIPTGREERAKLRSICERTLAFENHFLLIYKEFLLAEFRHGDEQGLLFALWVLKQNAYHDEEVLSAVRALINDPRVTIRDAVNVVLSNFTGM